MSKQENPLLTGLKKIPGLAITLPTRALLYNDGEVANEVKEEGEIHIHPMSARDELDMKNPDKLMSGEGIARVIAKCVPAIKKPRELYQADADAILIGLRIATYGEDLPIRVVNQYYDETVKGSAQELDFNINLKGCLQNTKYLDNIDDLKVELETGQIATIQPLKMSIALKIALSEAGDMPEEHEARLKAYSQRMDNIADVMLAMIYSIEDIKDRKMIEEWYDAVPASVFKALSDRAGDVSNIGPKMDVEMTDPISQKQWTTAIPVNPADFFGFGLNSETTKG